MANKGKHLMHTVGCVTLPCGFSSNERRRIGENQVIEQNALPSGA
jgi:hypothetical protein